MPANEAAPAPVAPAPAPAPAPAAGPNRDEHTVAAEQDAGGTWSKRLPGFYAGEDRDASSFRAATKSIDASWGKWTTPGRHFENVHTHYMDAGQQSAHEVSIEDGLLKRGGDLLSTAGASGVGTQLQQGVDKNIFTMTPGGTVSAASAWDERRETQLPSGAYSLGMINHSSLVAGGRAAAAGELKADAGKLQQLTDSSGHYQPDSRMTYQAAQHFEDAGVDMHDVSMKLWDKVNNRSHLHASAREFMGYEGATDAEQQMRTKRTAFKTELTDTVDERRTRLGIDDSDPVANFVRPAPAPAPPPPAPAPAPAPAPTPASPPTVYSPPPPGLF
jgi:hypothetical protein